MNENTAEEQMNSWSPWKSWWLDILKFGITFLLGAIMTITVINTLEERRSEQLFKATKAWERDLSILEEFRVASLQYVQATEGAMAEASMRRAETHNVIVRKWKEEAHDRILLSLETVKDRFSDRSDQIVENLIAIEESMHVLYAEFQDLRQGDNNPKPYMHSKALKRLKELRREMALNLEWIVSENK